MSLAVENISKLTGTQKVAIVLLSLSDANATKVFALMSEEEIMEISHAMSNLGTVSPEVMNAIMNELTTDIMGVSTLLGNLRNTERLLAKVLDKDKLATLMDEIRGPQGRNTWEKLAHVNEDLLALYFRNEHPQTVALILSKISSEHAAKVLSNLPDSFAFEIISRILNIGSVKKEVLERLERTLRAEFISSAGKIQKTDSVEMLAEIFNNFDRGNEVRFMSMLENNLPDAASQIKNMMFTFGDLVKISPKGLQRLLRDIEKSTLILALKGAPEEIKNILFASMSQRAAKIIEEELVLLGAVRVKEVDTARAEVVALAKQLIDAGEIDVAIGKGDDEFIT